MNNKRRTSILWLTTTSLWCHGPYCSLYHSSTSVDAFSITSQSASKRWLRAIGQPTTVARFHSTALGLSSGPSTGTRTATPLDCLDPDFFLHQVETSVHNALSQFPDHANNEDIQARKDFLLTLDGPQRESFGVAQNLHQRLSGFRKNNDCPRCWMQRAHCICKDVPPVTSSSGNTKTILPQLNRIFLIMHHKEIAMKVDTAKLILAAFPDKCRLVVAGIGPEYQASMKELYEAMADGSDVQNNNKKHCLVLFPDENAESIQDILVQDGQLPHSNESDADEMENDSSIQEANQSMNENYQPYDLIVLDGTWAQARKIHSKYIAPMEQGGPRRVQLSESAVEALQEANDQSGHQLRRHTVAWRQVGTYEATRLFLKDLEEALPIHDWLSSSSSTSSSSTEESLATAPVSEKISEYQSIANEAARRELGPPRESQNKVS